MTDSTHATASYSQETTASAGVIWELFEAVSSWKNWNTGVHACSIDGPFAVGSWLTMTLPDQEIIKSQLVEVDARHLFTDETMLGDIVVRVVHEIEPLPDRGNRITYKINVVGENAHDICAGVSSDFPEVLSALVAQAESRTTK
ncbi:hypothetical protein LMG24238_02110 [Paraburkholderia sediminicola]|uniref:Polyketide cyclase/dehydrase/lipid transport protein n=1 Tax=Paraburkholderia sediminicola TaxID=458836 RepID=A0A6J5AME7_9BURK|nr:SRPBCC family protein [Paraburkholderia sediminicola]CAB3671260.1 hypothetical protein LMG24238_02110 [Paraburkholderia sediminicola]